MMSQFKMPVARFNYFSFIYRPASTSRQCDCRQLGRRENKLQDASDQQMPWPGEAVDCILELATYEMMTVGQCFI